MMFFGALFALFTRKESVRGSVFSSAYFWHGLIFTTLFNAAVFYAALQFPDWMWMYFLEDSRNSPVELIYLFLFLYYLPYILGFYLGHLLVLKSRGLWLLFALFLLGWEGWLIVRLFDRYSVVGTRQDYLNGTAISLFSPQNPIGIVMNLAVGLMILYYLVVSWHYLRKYRRVAETEY